MSAARLAVSATLRSGTLPEHPLKNASDLELSLRIKYGAEHIKKHSDVDQFFSIHQHFAKDCFRSLFESLQPPRAVTDRLLEEINAYSGGGEAALMLHALGADANAATMIQDDMDFTPGIGEKERYTANIKHIFFKMVQKNPKKIKGQTGDIAADFATGEVVVDRLPTLSVEMDRSQGRGVYVYADHNSQRQDISLLAPRDSLIACLKQYKKHPEKFYWSPSYELSSGDVNRALVEIKVLHDLGAVHGSVIAFNMPDGDVSRLAFYQKLEDTGIFVCTQRGPPSSWQLSSEFMLTAQAITKIYEPSYVIATHSSETPLAQMSILDLVAQLQRDGWAFQQWSDKDDPPPPVVVETCRPKKFFMLSAESPVASRPYLICLNVIQTITVAKEVAHFQGDRHYKWLTSNGRNAKRSRNTMSIEDETGLDVKAITDLEASKRSRRGRLRGYAGGFGGGVGGRKGGKQPGDSRTFYWGTALITYSEKKAGGLQIQATCHRKVTHVNLKGNKAECRTTYSVNAAEGWTEAMWGGTQ